MDSSPLENSGFRMDFVILLTKCFCVVTDFVRGTHAVCPYVLGEKWGVVTETRYM